MLSAQAAHAGTVVQGADRSDAPLLIDPATFPADPFVATVDASSSLYTALIGRMPVSKTVNRVTVGDLAPAASCGSAPLRLRLSIREFAATENFSRSGGSQIAIAIADVEAPATPGKLVFDLPPTTLQKSKTYAFLLGTGTGSCRYAAQRTWARNSTTVNPSTERCTSPPRVGSIGRPGPGAGWVDRMWHQSGLHDVAAPCLSGTPLPSDFHASMPSGWLVVQSQYAVKTGSSNSSNPTATQICGADLAKSGAVPLYWQPLAGSPGWSEYVCAWGQYAPFGTDAPGGEGQHPDSAPREQVDAPDHRLDTEDAPIRPRRLDLRRERIPRVRQDTRERSSDHRRADVGESPNGAHDHRLRQINGGTVREQADRRLHEHESNRDERERTGATAPPLVQVERDPDCAREHDPDNQVPELPAQVEGDDRTERLAREPRRSCDEDRTEARLREAELARARDGSRTGSAHAASRAALRSRCSSSSHQAMLNSAYAMP